MPQRPNPTLSSQGEMGTLHTMPSISYLLLPEFLRGWGSLLGVVKESVPPKGMWLLASTAQNSFPSLPSSIPGAFLKCLRVTRWSEG